MPPPHDQRILCAYRQVYLRIVVSFGANLTTLLDTKYAILHNVKFPGVPFTPGIGFNRTPDMVCPKEGL
jgi:hypothetical protein